MHTKPLANNNCGTINTCISNRLVLVSGAAVEEMASDDDMEETVPMVTIGNTAVPYDEVTEDMVSRMTTAEKDTYISVGQRIYEDVYD